jgi:hypothetical protein
VSEAAQPTYSIAANLRWFAAVYVVASILYAFVINLLAKFGIDLPSVGVGIGVYVALVYVAGIRFAGRRGYAWASRDRHHLALGYAIITVLVAAVGATAAFFLTPLPQTSDLGAAVGIVVAIVILTGLISYGIARVILKLIARRGG